jgi:cyclophilin family peptidyl-prolyl cis-trans isomerase
MRKTMFVKIILLLGVMSLFACQNENAPVDEPNANHPNEEVIAEYETADADEDTYLLQLSPLKPGEELAVLHTGMGDVKIRFFPSEAPLAVENFITHARNGYYDGVIFHRVIEGFMIQGGDPLGNGTGGESIWQNPFGIEVTPQLHNIRGAVSMAKGTAPLSIGSQFFIVQNNKLTLGERTRIEGMRDKPKNTWSNFQGIFEKDDDGKGYTNEERMPSAFAQRYLDEGGAPFLDYGYTVFGQVFEGMDVVDKIAAVEVYNDEFLGLENRPVEQVIIESITIETYKELIK